MVLTSYSLKDVQILRMTKSNKTHLCGERMISRFLIWNISIEFSDGSLLINNKKTTPKGGFWFASEETEAIRTCGSDQQQSLDLLHW